LKRCKYNDPYIISSYYEGLLEDNLKEEFNNHLLACEECMNSLLNLEKDLFLMNTVKYKNIARGSEFSGVVFKFLEKGIRLVKDIDGLFSRPTLIPVRGKKDKGLYKMKKDGIEVNIGSVEKNLFYIELSGVYKKNFSLFCNKKLIEARANLDREKEIIQNLEKGKYTININDKKLIDFDVE